MSHSKGARELGAHPSFNSWLLLVPVLRSRRGSDVGTKAPDLVLLAPLGLAVSPVSAEACWLLGQHRSQPLLCLLEPGGPCDPWAQPLA